MKDTVTLVGVGKGEKEFSVEHAERILNIKTPPKVWKLSDSQYDFLGGKLVKKTVTQD